MLTHSEPICTAPKSIWNDIRLPTRLIELWKNHSAKQIAYILADEFQIGITRNMVISKIRRLGLSVENKTEISPKTRYRTNVPVRPRPKLRIVRSSVNPSTYKVIQSVQTDLPLFQCVEVEPRHLTLDQLGPFDCRQPYGDGPFTFCGRIKRAGSSYCTAHHLANWIPPTARNRAARGVR